MLKEIAMSHFIALLVRDSLAGRHAQSAAACAALRAREGSMPQAALELAAQAAARGDSRLLSLAFALWPEAQGSAAKSFLGGLPLSAAKFCLSRSDALRSVAEAALKEEAAARQRLPSPPRRAAAPAAIGCPKARALEEGLRSRRQALGRSEKEAPVAAPATAKTKVRLRPRRASSEASSASHGRGQAQGLSQS